MKSPHKAPHILQLIYLYILSFVGIVITIVSSVGVINLVLKNYVFQVDSVDYYYADICRTPKTLDNTNASVTPSEDEIRKCEQAEKEKALMRLNNETKRDLASSIAGIVVGTPLWLYHWGIIRKRKPEEE